MNVLNKGLVIAVASLSLLACGGSKPVVTSDESVDYKPAQSLPALKKPQQGSALNNQQATSPISMELIDYKSTARLRVNAEFDLAWKAVNRQVQKSDITLFTRNIDAKLFLIGCRGVEDADQKEPTTAKKKHFKLLKKSIFKDNVNSDHCQLRFKENRNETFVEVLNRQGEEIDSQRARLVLTRLMSE